MHNITLNQFYGKDEISESLDLRSLTSIPEGFNPTVGGSLYLKNKEIDINSKIDIILWQEGKYVKVDGIFTEVVKKKGNVYHVKKLNQDKIFYLVTDGNRYSHGDTLKDAKDDLIYKIDGRNKDDFKHLKLKDVLSLEDAIICYRVVTGACSFGVKDFIANRLKSKKKSFSIQEIVDLTKNEYQGNTFKSFFKNKENYK